jgi:hypothetical protein
LHVTLLGLAVLTLNRIGATKMELDRATNIINKMVKERHGTIGSVLAEYLRYQKNGECTHFWPDENTACQMFIARRVSK